MEFHPLAGIFPMMEGKKFATFKADIAEYGLRELITLAEGKIVDGRNRYNACIELDIEPKYQEWDGIGSLLAFIISMNLQRRHLNESQRAMVAAKIANMKSGTRTDLEPSLNLDEVSAVDAAQTLSVSRASVFQAKKVISEGASELARAVERGNIAVSLAAKAIKLPEVKQKELVTQITEKNRKPASVLKSIKKEEKRQRYIASANDIDLSMETCRLIHGNFAEVAKQLADESIDVIITDPPYAKKYLSLYKVLAIESARLLKPGGSLLAMAGQSYLPDVLDMLKAHLTYHWTIAYETLGGQAAMIRHRNVNTFWKPVFWFVKDKYKGDWRGDLVVSNMNDKRFHDWGQSEGGIGKLVADYTLPSDLILDPFVGGGTVAVVCLRLGRRFIGIDIDEAQINITKGRLADEQKRNDL